MVMADEHLIVVLHQLHFYHFGPNSGLVYETFDVDCPDLEVSGRVSLGSWQGAPDATRLLSDNGVPHLCEIAGSGTVDYKSLVCDTPVSSYPQSLAPECTGCMYGSSNCSACQCYVGFWGESCDNVCPGWLGADCAVLPSDVWHVSSDDLVAAPWRGQATVMALDGTTFELTIFRIESLRHPVEVRRLDRRRVAASSAEASSVYDRFTGGATDSDKVGVCLLFNNNGMNINSLSALPSGSFTLEIQVDPISYGGVVLSHHSAATLSVVNREIHHGGHNLTRSGTTRCPSCTCSSPSCSS